VEAALMSWWVIKALSEWRQFMFVLEKVVALPPVSLA
jgi:hypothetical protein